jgi:hypothetical protein
MLIIAPDATYGESFDACVEFINKLVELQKKAVETLEEKREGQE